MDMNALGTHYLNQSYIPLASSNRETGNSEGSDFKEILKKAQNSQGRITGEPPVQKEISGPVLRNAPIDKNDKLYELCMELETFLIKNLIKSMRGTVQKSELIKTGFAGGIYEDMLYDEYAKDYAKNANFGFAEMAYRELSR